MRRILSFLLCMLIVCTAVFAQDESVNRKNAAVLVNVNIIDLRNGVPVPISNELAALQKDLEAALHSFGTNALGKIAYGVVNRNDELAALVQSQLKEQKLEDYINGFSVQAKNAGADVLLLIDLTITNIDNKVGQVFFDSRIMDVATNRAFHNHYVSDPIPVGSLYQQLPLTINSLKLGLEKFLAGLYPQQFFVIEPSTKGKNWNIVSPEASRFFENTVFHIFDCVQKPYFWFDTPMTANILKPIGLASLDLKKKPETGINIKTDVKYEKGMVPIIVPEMDRFNMRNALTTATYYGFTPKEQNSMTGLIMKRINETIKSSMSMTPGLQLIEQEYLDEIKAERELQKTEDFLNGHTVDQMKAIGANYIYHVDNLVIDQDNVAFDFNLIDVAQNKIIRTIPISTTLNNLEADVSGIIIERLPLGVTVESADKKEIKFLSPVSYPEGTTLIFYSNLPVSVKGQKEKVMTKTNVLTGEVIASQGNLTIIQPIKKDKNLKHFEDLIKLSKEQNLKVYIEGESFGRNFNKKSIFTAVEKEKKKEKRKAIFKSLVNNLLEEAQNPGSLSNKNKEKINQQLHHEGEIVTPNGHVPSIKK